VDTTSDAPIGVNERMRKILLEANRGKSTAQRMSALAKLRPGMLLKPTLPRNSEPRTGSFDGRTLRADGQALEDLARGAGRACARQSSKAGGRRTSAVFSTT
jgi:hypothetical protein